MQFFEIPLHAEAKLTNIKTEGMSNLAYNMCVCVRVAGGGGAIIKITLFKIKKLTTKIPLFKIKGALL